MKLTLRPNHRVARWMYRGGRPNRLARPLNAFTARLSTIGVWPGRMVTLQVPGRRTGRIMSLPLVVADWHGERYLVSMLGQEANWVLNVRAAGGAVTLEHGRRDQVRLVEVPPDERAPILRRYLQVAPGGRAHVPVPYRAPLEEFAAIAAAYPVFRITGPTA